MRLGAEEAAERATATAVVLDRLSRLRPELRLRVALPETVEIALPEGSDRIALPDDAEARAMMRSAPPELLVLFGNELPKALIEAAGRARRPVMMVDASAGAAPGHRPPFRRFGQPALLRRLERVLVREQASIAPLLQLGVELERLKLGGMLGQPPEPLRCSEAERVSLAALTRTRPVWFGASVPPGEIEALVAAQERAQRHAHRMLLILAPEIPETAAELAAELSERGHAVACRSVEGEPGEETEIFLADDPGEYGLWYRIAPVSYMGGTLNGGSAAPRGPFEPAALGSAILHGPQTAPHGADFARLDEARAARAIHDAISLGEAVADLMSPDRAAVLAHNAWAVISDGAAAAETVVAAILREYDAARRRKDA
ncbi:3-deoxy-D-manno-octulosonic acid transferase [Rhodobacter maris]|uniref:3-deoxy-D-manno-octulosonic acid transferase n=1 Tax=Rhodobacter maris TaxID=446682 RepID=A0A285RMS5_9RHOB|nr:3-deoxy-D-manno-octulosonic acid transferase [Rhodobacter maris]SOB94999.1 3-deoxy-D-manno-octulosonic-acid transferase [Rhodobacter maris]